MNPLESFSVDTNGASKPVLCCICGDDATRYQPVVATEEVGCVGGVMEPAPELAFCDRHLIGKPGGRTWRDMEAML